MSTSMDAKSLVREALALLAWQPGREPYCTHLVRIIAFQRAAQAFLDEGREGDGAAVPAAPTAPSGFAGATVSETVGVGA